MPPRDPVSTDTSLAKSGEEEKRAYSLDYPHSFCMCQLSCVFFEFVVELFFRSRTVVDYYAKLEGCFFALVELEAEGFRVVDFVKLLEGVLAQGVG